MPSKVYVKKTPEEDQRVARCLCGKPATEKISFLQGGSHSPRLHKGTLVVCTECRELALKIDKGVK